MSTIQNTLGKMSNYRWTICAMLFFATTVNYLDRQVLSLTWDEFIKPEFHWDESHYGTITAVFSFVYAACMLLQVVSWIGWDLKRIFMGYRHLVFRCLYARSLRYYHRTLRRSAQRGRINGSHR